MEKRLRERMMDRKSKKATSLQNNYHRQEAQLQYPTQQDRDRLLQGLVLETKAVVLEEDGWYRIKERKRIQDELFGVSEETVAGSYCIATKNTIE